MVKEVTISILEDIQNTLNKEDWKNETLNYEKKLKDSQKVEKYY